jgi:hypothetical protein
MGVSKDHARLALLLGKTLIKNQKDIETLVILRKCHDDEGTMTMEEETRIDMRKLGLSSVCNTFYFDINDDSKLIFVN